MTQEVTTRKSANRVKFPHGPIRTCVICRKKAPKRELRSFSLPRQRAAGLKTGRSAYVCLEHEAGQIEKNKKKLAKALRCDAQAMHIHLNGEIRS